jgi:hypothetical protein
MVEDFKRRETCSKSFLFPTLVQALYRKRRQFEAHRNNKANERERIESREKQRVSFLENVDFEPIW